jgi:hypothetical protein
VGLGEHGPGLDRRVGVGGVAQRMALPDHRHAAPLRGVATAGATSSNAVSPSAPPTFVEYHLGAGAAERCRSHLDQLDSAWITTIVLHYR